jgi:hypothetical protein
VDTRFVIGGPIGESVVAGSINLASAIIRQGCLKLKARWLSSSSSILNHDIQDALTQAFVRVLTYLEEQYFTLGEARALPPDTQTSIRLLFGELEKQAQRVFASSLGKTTEEQKVNDYIDVTQEMATDNIWEQTHGASLLSTYPEHLRNFLRHNLLNEVQRRFGEILKTDHKARHAVVLLWLEEIRADVKAVKANQNLIRQDLQKLEELINQLSRLLDTIDHHLSDEPFQQRLEKAVKQMQDVLTKPLTPQPALEPRVYEENVPGLSRFFYGARIAPFLGREEEIKALENFLADEKRFCWWLVIGQGGLGKSRLALELCLRNKKDWQAGFLPTCCSLDEYRNWVPNQPTLIIADYAASHATVIGNIVRMIKLQGDNGRLLYPVRLLLLERRVKRFYEGTEFYPDPRNEEWFDNFLGDNGSAQAATQSTWYAGGQDPIELGPLDPEHTWTIIHTFGQGKVKEEEKGQILGELRHIDPLCRPLYAAMLGDAIGAGRSPRLWDARAILRDFLAREEKMFWTPAGVGEKEKDVLALVTMAGDIDRGSASLPRKIGEMIDPKLNFSPRRYRLMSPGSTNTILRPLEPDIIGELFVLEHLNSENPRRDQIKTMAWVLNREKTTLFLLRVTNDFPKHPTLEYLLGTL